MSAGGDAHPAGRRAAVRSSLVVGLLVATVGCSARDDDPHRLVIATPWPPAARAACEALFADEGGHHPITWVELGAHRWGDACDRRGGVDLVLGGPAHVIQALADAGRLVPLGSILDRQGRATETDKPSPVPWWVASRPAHPSSPATGPDPRDANGALGAARAVLIAEGWAEGYATLVRRPVGWSPCAVLPDRSQPPPASEAVALVRGGRHPDMAQRFLGSLARQGWIAPAPRDADVAARIDDLLADLLGAVLIDARNERRDAQMALAAHGRPAIAEAAYGAPPPWPPASVAKLQADPARAPLADALAEQISPDPAARFWLQTSWHGPSRRVDLDLLREIALADEGRLVREPRFRAWLRGEWTAWTQQLYRRVARLAGGYRPA